MIWVQFGSLYNVIVHEFSPTANGAVGGCCGGGDAGGCGGGDAGGRTGAPQRPTLVRFSCIRPLARHVGERGGSGGDGTMQAVCAKVVHTVPAVRMKPRQQLARPPGRVSQALLPHWPHDAAQQAAGLAPPRTPSLHQPGGGGGLLGGDGGGTLCVTTRKVFANEATLSSSAITMPD